MIPDRILDKILIVPFEECWHWTGAVCNRKAGNLTPWIKYEGKAQPLRRVIFELLVGEVPEGEGLRVVASCGQLDCVRPEHIALACGRDTLGPSHEAQRRNRKARTHFRCGHARTAENTILNRRKTYTGEYCRKCKKAQTVKWVKRRSSERAARRARK